ncbi:hypothetical protein Tco_1027765 [Tanacetum coccineum]
MAIGYQNSFYLKQAQQKQQSLYNGKVLLDKHDPPAVYDSEETLQLAQGSHDTSPNVARKFLNAVKDTIATLQRVVKSRMSLNINNWSSLVPQVVHKILKDEIAPIEADESFDKIMILDKENDRLLRAVISHDILSIVQNHSVMFLEKENEHLKAIYQTLFDSIKQTRAQAKIKTDSLQEKLNDTIYENAKLRAQLFGKWSKQNDTVKGMSANTKFAKPSILGKPPS